MGVDILRSGAFSASRKRQIWGASRGAARRDAEAQPLAWPDFSNLTASFDETRLVRSIEIALLVIV